MYQRVKIDHYRAFKSLDVPDLARVNLFVGKNNAGKTAFLEAIELLAAGGDPSVLRRGLLRREELLLRPDGGSGESALLDPSHLFYGHRMEKYARFELSGEGAVPSRSVACTVVPLMSMREDEPGIDQQERLFDTAVDQVDSPMALRIDRGHMPSPTIRITDDGGISLRGMGIRRLSESGTAEGLAPVHFVDTNGDYRRELAAHWDQVVLRPDELRVTEFLRVIQPDLERVAFLSANAIAARSQAIVKLTSGQDRYPIGSMGDGLKRLLAIALMLARARGGVCLIDEVDTGLHYSTLEDLWRLVVTMARDMDVQVFATSHSGDCIRALAWLAEDRPELACDVRLHRIDSALATTTVFTADEVALAARNYMELRG